jgi:hypothetical protein
MLEILYLIKMIDMIQSIAKKSPGLVVFCS